MSGDRPGVWRLLSKNRKKVNCEIGNFMSFTGGFVVKTQWRLEQSAQVNTIHTMSIFQTKVTMALTWSFTPMQKGCVLQIQLHQVRDRKGKDGIYLKRNVTAPFKVKTAIQQK